MTELQLTVDGEVLCIPCACEYEDDELTDWTDEQAEAELPDRFRDECQRCGYRDQDLAVSLASVNGDEHEIPEPGPWEVMGRINGGYNGRSH